MDKENSSANLQKMSLTLAYIKYQNSNLSAVEFCKKYDIPYLEFTEEVARWNQKYGGRTVEECMERIELNTRTREPQFLPSLAQHRFGEIVVEPDPDKCRSRRKFPKDPLMYVELEQPEPGTVVQEATITFPSGISLTMSHSTIKSLILSVVLYEEFDTWAYK